MREGFRSPSHYRSSPRRRSMIRRIVRSTIGLLALGLIAGSSAVIAQVDEREQLFESEIRPLLVARCIGCHGPFKQEADLRLDSWSAIEAGSGNGPVIVSGDAEASVMIAAVERRGDSPMPPDRELEPKEVAALRQWINEGAYWPAAATGDSRSLAERHWAFQPVANPRVPVPNDAEGAISNRSSRVVGWDAREPLDLFLAQAQATRGVIASSEANRDTLLRRVTYDLTGLPPTAAELDEFRGDSRPDAYERQVDRLLAAAPLGEHWTRHWLDVARYADNKGYVFFEQKEFRWAWAYRDWVRRAFDADLPYDEFLTRQLAADQVIDQHDSPELAALGFLTVGGHFVNNTHDIIDDRIDVVSRGLTGLTMTCARCHDHKYDPMTQADYYAFYGIFASSYEPLVPPSIALAADGRPATLATDDAYQAELDKRDNDLNQLVQSKVDGLAQSGRRRVDEYLLAVHARRDHPSAEEFMLIADPDDVNPSMITRYESYLREQVDERHPIWGPWLRWSASDEQFWRDPAESLRQQPERWLDPQWNPRLVNYLTEPPVASVAELAARYGELFRWVDDVSSSGDSATATEPAPTSDEANPVAAIGWTDEDRARLRDELFAEGRPAVLPVQLDWGFLSLFPDRATQGEYTAKLHAVEEWLNQESAPVRAMVLLDRPQAADARVFLRGNPNRPGDLVERSIFVPGETERREVPGGSGRLELARALTDTNHPTTDRVWVNRVWMHVIGEPIVGSPGDFGLRTNEPELSDLLDHLVTEFREHDRSLKSILRHLVISSTYRRSSEADAQSLAIDPANAVFGRAVRKRLSFEAMRDSLLAAAGQLSSRRGGPAEPALENWGHRRSLYAFIDRLDVAPILSRFDFPDPAATAPRRGSTTVPTQALFWMNHGQIESIARELVSLSARETSSTDDSARVTWLTRTIWQREATEDEVAEFLDFVRGEPSADEGWIRLTQALLMANETVFID